MTVVDIRPTGTLANPDNSFTQDTTVTTAAVGNWQAQIKAGDPAPDIDNASASTAPSPTTRSTATTAAWKCMPTTPTAPTSR